MIFRTLNSLTRRGVSLLHDVVAEWRKFWFEPADPYTLGLIRVLTGMMLTYNLLVWGLDLEAFFSQKGLQPLSAVTSLYEDTLVFSFLTYVPDSWLRTVHWLCVVVAALFCLGIGTRLTSLLAFLITISYSQRVPIANFGLDQILGMLCLYLAIGPSGVCLSVDAWLRKRRIHQAGRVAEIPRLASARTVLRLIQIHVCVIYFWAGFAKLKGASWWTGEAMWQVIANQEYQTMDLTWMAWVPWLPYLIAHITVAWEVFFCVLVWRPRLQSLMLAMGTAMHLGIGAFLGMWTFGLIMTFPYLAFGDPSRWRRWLSLRSAKDHTPLTTDAAGNNLPAAANDQQMKAFVSTPESEVLIVAIDSTERSTFRSYLRRHDIPCRAAATASHAVTMVLSRKPGVILLSGSCLPAEQIHSLIADLNDVAETPILALLTESQQNILRESTLSARVLSYPASLRHVRTELTSIMLEADGAGLAQTRPTASGNDE